MDFFSGNIEYRLIDNVAACECPEIEFIVTSSVKYDIFVEMVNDK